MTTAAQTEGQAGTQARVQQAEVTVPDLGDFHDIPVIEVHVSEGDVVAVDDPLITLESDKATMDVPAPRAGRVERLTVSVGDRVDVGTPILSLALEGLGEEGQEGADAAAQAADLVQQDASPSAVAGTTNAAAASAARAGSTGAAERPPAPAPPPAAQAQPAASGPAGAVPDGQPHAGPSVRRLARELGVELGTVRGTGPKGRITKDDLLAAVRGPATASAPQVSAGSGIPEIPPQDFSRFGPVETVPLPRIKALSGPHLHRSWLNVPHVTQNDEADITDLDAYRRELDATARAEGYRVTLLAFLLKAAVSMLRAHPELNSSLSPEKDSLIVKGYYHIGVAVDTPGGLVVPVLRDVDRKGVLGLSKELGEVSARAREGKLTPADLQGGTFTISSLGGIGGTSFTPIVNAPEVAILGVVRAKTAPVWNGKKFKPRLMLPLSLSYDHRVIDGALAARAVRDLAHVLEDVRRLLL
jgi:pyruvate dehydrogenase E2 component (dihydrolipoamide acetyltransferase)